MYRASSTRILVGPQATRAGRRRRLSWCAPTAGASFQRPTSKRTSIRARRAPAASSPGRSVTASCSGLLALLLAIPATWRTATLYRHLRSEIEELLPRDAPSVVAIDELRHRMAGPAVPGRASSTSASPDRLAAGERFLDDLAARVRAYPRELGQRRAHRLRRRSAPSSRTTRPRCWTCDDLQGHPRAHRGPAPLGVRARRPARCSTTTSRRRRWTSRDIEKKYAAELGGPRPGGRPVLEREAGRSR